MKQVSNLDSEKYFQNLFPESKKSDKIAHEKHYHGDRFLGTSFVLSGDFIGEPELGELDISRLTGNPDDAGDYYVGDRTCSLELLVDRERDIGIKTLRQLSEIAAVLPKLAELIDASLTTYIADHVECTKLDQIDTFSFNISTNIKQVERDGQIFNHAKQRLDIEIQIRDQTYLLRLHPEYSSLADVFESHEMIRDQISRFSEELWQYFYHHSELADKREKDANRTLDNF